MRLSTKGRYAITAMLDLALNARDGHKITLADISEFQGISLSYLEQLFARLRQAKLVQGTRGPGGGYRLALPAHDISITDIVVAVDDKFDMPSDQNQIDIRHQKTHELWNILSNQIHEYLDGVTLGMLVDQDNEPTTAALSVDEKQDIPNWSSNQIKQNAFNRAL